MSKDGNGNGKRTRKPNPVLVPVEGQGTETVETTYKYQKEDVSVSFVKFNDVGDALDAMGNDNVLIAINSSQFETAKRNDRNERDDKPRSAYAVARELAESDSELQDALKELLAARGETNIKF